jgi:primosomal protein N' (replication factor Y)
VGERAVLSGPVAVCVDRPVLSLDRPFTYDLPGELGAGVGSLVQVPFHGRDVRGWVLGPAEEVPPRVLAVRRVVSPVRFFDRRMLQLFRWISERYVAPLAAVIARSHPPRVASEERTAGTPAGPGRPTPAGLPWPVDLSGYRGGRELLRAVSGGAGAFVLRPGPDDEVRLAVGLVGACLAGGRRAIVLVPEADPLPATAAAVLEAFGTRARAFLGGDRRERYRTWLAMADEGCDVVVGTRPAVFAPLADLGLLLVSRESHPGHREERAPSHHVREVALARARLEGAACVLSATCPSVEAAALGLPVVEPAGRRWPPVEVVRPGPEGRAPRLVRALRGARRAFLYEPLPGYGVARVCRSCGEPAACGSCGGLLRAEAGAVRCAVCGGPGRCRSCGGERFGIVRGGAERVEEWAGAVAPVPVRRAEGPPRGEEVVVAGPEAVKDVGPLGLDLVAILDADRPARLPGLAAEERALAAWMEAAAWAYPGGRVIVQTAHPNRPAVQALVQGNPRRFQRVEAARREEAGFPPGFPVFRVRGGPGVVERIRALGPRSLLTTASDEGTVCLVALDPGLVPSFGRAMRALAERDPHLRVEAEPHL